MAGNRSSPLLIPPLTIPSWHVCAHTKSSCALMCGLFESAPHIVHRHDVSDLRLAPTRCGTVQCNNTPECMITWATVFLRCASGDIPLMRICACSAGSLKVPQVPANSLVYVCADSSPPLYLTSVPFLSTMDMRSFTQTAKKKQETVYVWLLLDRV